MIEKEKLNKTIDKYNVTHQNVVHDLRISAEAFRLYTILYNSSDNYDPNEKSLAVQLGVNEKTIYRWIKELKHYGYMTIRGSKSSGYTWKINKCSKGVFKSQADKFVTLRNRSKQTEMSDKNRTKMSDTIRTMAAPTGEAAIANNEIDEIDLNLGINVD